MTVCSHKIVGTSAGAPNIARAILSAYLSALRCPLRSIAGVRQLIATCD